MGNKKKYPSKVSKSGNRSRRMKRLITAREWHLKRQRGQLEEQPRLEQSEVVSCRTENNLSDVKEEVIEVEEPQLVKVKDEPVDAAEYILSDNPVDVHLEEEPANEGGFSYVANNSDSFDIGTRPGSTQVKKLSVREVDSMFVDFATRFKSLSLKTQQTLKAKISQLLSEAEATEGGQHQ